MTKNIWLARILALCLYGIIGGVIGKSCDTIALKKEGLPPEYTQVMNLIKEEKLDIWKIRVATHEGYPFYAYFIGAVVQVCITLALYWVIKACVLRLLPGRHAPP